MGRTWTAPGARTDRLRFAFCSCQNYEDGWYTAFRHMAAEDLELVVHLGDYIYEVGRSRRAVHPHDSPEVFTLDEYRSRYALYRGDHDLQAAHVAFPWIATWDDHDVDNNYAGGVPENGVDSGSSSCAGPPRTRRTMSSCRCAGAPRRAGSRCRSSARSTSAT